MAIKTSGPLSMTEIVAEFGGAAPHSLSEYYGATAGIPTSGAIAFNQFYGKSAIIALTLPVGDFRRINLADWVVSQGYAANQAFQITVPSNTSYWSDSIALPAVDASGLGSLHLINNGKILGKGGDGYSAPSSGVFTYTLSQRTALGILDSGETHATDGGPALSMCAGTVTNNGYIAGGGGGGAETSPYSTNAYNGFSFVAGGTIKTMSASQTGGFGQTSSWHLTVGSSLHAYNPLDLNPTLVASWPSAATNNWWGSCYPYQDGSQATGQAWRSGGGGGAGGGQGGATSMTDSLDIGGVTAAIAGKPAAVTAIGQTGTATFRRGGTIDSFNVSSVGYNTEKPATASDGGGANGCRHRSSSSSLAGGEIY